MVQKMMQKVLESIYEPTFPEVFLWIQTREGCHDAIEDLHDHLFGNEVQTVIDIDLENFFGTIDHKEVVRNITRIRIKDQKFDAIHN